MKPTRARIITRWQPEPRRVRQSTPGSVWRILFSIACGVIVASAIARCQLARAVPRVHLHTVEKDLTQPEVDAK